jgi:hypothetical protein
MTGDLSVIITKNESLQEKCMAYELEFYHHALEKLETRIEYIDVPIVRKNKVVRMSQRVAHVGDLKDKLKVTDFPSIRHLPPINFHFNILVRQIDFP